MGERGRSAVGGIWSKADASIIAGGRHLITVMKSRFSSTHSLKSVLKAVKVPTPSPRLKDMNRILAFSLYRFAHLLESCMPQPLNPFETGFNLATRPNKIT